MEGERRYWVNAPFSIPDLFECGELGKFSDVYCSECGTKLLPKTYLDIDAGELISIEQRLSEDFFLKGNYLYLTFHDKNTV